MSLPTSATDIGYLESKMLVQASVFLYGRYLEAAAENQPFISTLSEDVRAYSLSGKENVIQYINNFSFDSFCVASIRADYRQRCVFVEYEDSSSSEKLFFRSDGEQIESIRSDYLGEIGQLDRRLQTCGGVESRISIRTLQSIRMLKLATTFLYVSSINSTLTHPF